jgi:hypothetical protein
MPRECHADFLVPNGTPFVPTLVPVLLQILAQIESAQQLLPPGLIYTLPRNKVVEVFIPWLGGPVSGFAICIYRSITSCRSFSIPSTCVYVF